jgi:hypothetical protein
MMAIPITDAPRSGMSIAAALWPMSEIGGLPRPSIISATSSVASSAIAVR